MSKSSPPSTAYKDEPQQLHADHNHIESPLDRRDSRLTFATAAFAFRDALDNSRRKKTVQPTVTEHEVKESPKTPEVVDSGLEEEKAHMARHKGRIRIARTIQHLLSSILSLVILGLQADICSKAMNNLPPDKKQSELLKELLPALMLLVTAVAAIIFDICALTAYFWPSTPFGKKAYALALKAHYLITTFKSVAYAYSTVGCAGMTHDPADVTMVVSMGLSTTNIAIELIGLVIDQYVKRDADRFKRVSGMSAASASAGAGAPAAAASSSDSAPLLPAYSFRQGPYQKLSDEDFDQLDDLGNGLSGDVEKLKPKVSSS